jgi:transcriptional regulator with XRE-family HTH domain
MFEDHKLLRQARTMLGVSKREVAEIAGEKESSVADVEAGRKRLRAELAHKLWAALWTVLGKKGQRFTKEQMEKHENLLDMMLCAHNGLAVGISPDKLLVWFRGEGNNLTTEERQSYNAYIAALPTPEADPLDNGSRRAPLTFIEAETMPHDQVARIVANEIMSSNWFLLMYCGKSPTPEEHEEALAAQLRNDPRVKIASAKAWIARVEKQRDDLKRELQEAKEAQLKLSEELIEVYRQVLALEKELEPQKS